MMRHASQAATGDRRGVEESVCRRRYQVRQWRVPPGEARCVAKTVASTIFALISRHISMIGEYIGLEKRDQMKVFSSLSGLVGCFQ